MITSAGLTVPLLGVLSGVPCGSADLVQSPATATLQEQRETNVHGRLFALVSAEDYDRIFGWESRSPIGMNARR